MRVLFVLKNSGSGPQEEYGYTSTGLLHSANFIAEMLQAQGVDAKVVSVPDNTYIDSEVQKFDADVVFIEGLWVVPEKFVELHKLKPHVKWVIRLHSDWPFLSTEGVATTWLFDYVRLKKVFVAFNAEKTAHDFKGLVHQGQKHRVLYLPDFFPLRRMKYRQTCAHPTVRIGCFGALRTLKNQLIQAVAAIEYADSLEKGLEYHINASAIESSDGGAEILKNIRGLFDNNSHTLIEHTWMERPAFLELLKSLDVVLAVSMSETFCITAADAVSEGVPLVCSGEIPWATGASIVQEVTRTASIVARIYDARSHDRWVTTMRNQFKLWRYSKTSRRIWLETLGAF